MNDYLSSSEIFQFQWNKIFKMKDWKQFNREIENLTLTELETRIKELHSKFQRNKKDYRLSFCLVQRKYLMNEKFKFTPEAVNHIERVNRILTENEQKVWRRSILLYRQMMQNMLEGDDFLDGFMIEGTVGVAFNNSDSLLTLTNDENEGQSDYETMSEILDDEKSPDYLELFLFSEADMDSINKSDEELVGPRMKVNWNIELLEAPELSHIEKFCYSSHALFCDSNYSLSDIIRINNFENNVVVTHENTVRVN
jgi:hypothetical protein